MAFLDGITWQTPGVTPTPRPPTRAQGPLQYQIGATRGALQKAGQFGIGSQPAYLARWQSRVSIPGNERLTPLKPAQQRTAPNLYDRLMGAYQPYDASKITDPYMKQAADWLNYAGANEIANKAAALREAEANRQAQTGAARAAYEYQNTEQGRNYTADNRNLVSMLNSRGILDSGITGNRAGELLDRYRTAEALRSRDQQAFENQLAMQGQNELQQSFDEIAAYRAGLPGQIANLANTLRDQGFNRSVTEAGLTGKYNNALTTAEQQRLFGNKLSEGELTGSYNGKRTLPASQLDWQKTLDEADLTGHYNGQWTVPYRQIQADMTGNWFGKPTLAGLLSQYQGTGLYYNPAGYPGGSDIDYLRSLRLRQAANAANQAGY